MAMRPRPPRSGVPIPRRPRVAKPVYEDFKPVSEWQQDEESNPLLVIYLPGFLKKHIKVSTEGRNVLRVHGERLDTSNKWSRFQEEYRVPEDCNIRGIHARLEGGILTVTMPRLINEAQDGFKDKATQETPTSQSQRTQENLKLGPNIQKQPSSPEEVVEPRPQKVVDDVPSKVTSPITADHKGKDDKSLQSPSDTKIFDEPQGITSQEVQQMESNNETKAKPMESEEHKKSEVATDHLEIDQKAKELEKHEKRKATEESKSAEKENKGGRAYFEKIDDIRSTEKPTFKRMLDQLNEERQLLVIVGAVVLVILAFGAYISFTFGSR